MTDLTGATDYSAMMAAKATYEALANTDINKHAAFKTYFGLVKSCVEELGGDCSMLNRLSI